MADILLPPRDQYLLESAICGGMDLLFLAHTRHLKHADNHLAALGLGRAHHRVLYFVARKPDLTITELLRVLGVKKQSVNLVLKELFSRGLLEQRFGDRDRRQRLLRLTKFGSDLEKSISGELQANFAHAYRASGSEAVAGLWTVLQHLIGEEGRATFALVQRP